MYTVPLVFSTIFSTYILINFMSRRSSSAFHPAFFYICFHFLVFVIRPIFSVIYDYQAIYNAIEFNPTQAERITVILAADIALGCFYWACITAGGSELQFKQTPYDDRNRSMLKSSFLIISAPLGLLAIYSLVALWGLMGSGQSINVMDPRTGHTALSGVNGYLLSAGSMLAIISVMAAWLFRFSWVSLIPFAVFSVLRLGSGGRGDFVIAAVMLGLLVLYSQKIRWPTLKTAASAVLVAWLFAAVVQDRGQFIRQYFVETELSSKVYNTSELNPLESMDYGNMEFFEFIVHVVPNKTGTYDYFVSNLQIITEPIPRALWPNKPVGPPIIMMNLYDWGHPIGMTMSVPGAGWFYMGMVGVVIWSLFFGFIYGTGYRIFANSKQSNYALFIYLSFLATSIIAYRDGFIMTILKQNLFFIIPVFCLMMAARALQVPSAEEIKLAHMRILQRALDQGRNLKRRRGDRAKR